MQKSYATVRDTDIVSFVSPEKMMESRYKFDGHSEAAIHGSHTLSLTALAEKNTYSALGSRAGFAASPNGKYFLIARRRIDAHITVR